jgi:hypothetical protein
MAWMALASTPADRQRAETGHGPPSALRTHRQNSYRDWMPYEITSPSAGADASAGAGGVPAGTPDLGELLTRKEGTRIPGL